MEDRNALFQMVYEETEAAPIVAGEHPRSAELWTGSSAVLCEVIGEPIKRLA